MCVCVYGGTHSAPLMTEFIYLSVHVTLYVGIGIRAKKDLLRYSSSILYYFIMYLGGRYYARKNTVKPRDTIRCVHRFDDDRSFNNSLFGLTSPAVLHTTMILTTVIVVILTCDKSAADCCTVTLYEFISPYYTRNKLIFFDLQILHCNQALLPRLLCSDQEVYSARYGKSSG